MQHHDSWSIQDRLGPLDTDVMLNWMTDRYLAYKIAECSARDHIRHAIELCPLLTQH